MLANTKPAGMLFTVISSDSEKLVPVIYTVSPTVADMGLKLSIVGGPGGGAGWAYAESEPINSINTMRKKPLRKTGNNVRVEKFVMKVK